MILPVIFSQPASEEFEDARVWNEERRSGLGQEFVSCLQAAIDQLQRTPFRHPEVEPGVRRALVRRFPYAVLYVVDVDRIFVLAVFHSSRDPRVWKARM